TLVQVQSCTNAGDLSPVGRVDVQPLVNQLDGALNAVPHAVVYDVPYLRVQGGANAVIIDPQPGDIGIAVFASRDISAVKSSRQQSNPGSGRKMDMADALYLGGVLNGAPAQYVRFGDDGITVHSPQKITLSAPNIEINADNAITATAPQATINAATLINGPLSQGTGEAGGGATMAGPLQVSADVTAGGVTLMQHTHPGVQTGDGNTGAPNP
ncbi:MAG: oxidoreductase, partial [Burkholderiaceae bacterium]|nr:oxidoreductase [Burkholderiaceae bacterium]